MFAELNTFILLQPLTVQVIAAGIVCQASKPVTDQRLLLKTRQKR